MQRLVPSALLHAHSFFSEGAGVSSPKRLARLAAAQGYEYLALTDELSVGGAVELHHAAKEHGLKAITGASVPILVERESYPLVLIAASRRGYQDLNELLTHAKDSEAQAVPLGVLEPRAGELFALTGGRGGYPSQLLGRRKARQATTLTQQLKNLFHDRLMIQLYHDREPQDAVRGRALRNLARDQGLAVVAAPEVRYATPDLYPLYDAFVCGRLGITVREPHPQRPRNEAQYLLSPEEAGSRIPYQEAWANADALAAEAHFELLPERLVPPPAKIPQGMTPQGYLEERCYAALLEKYRGKPQLGKARARLEQELATLRALGLADFFLLAAEVTDYCRARGIIAAGRGSAAASVVCYLLGVTLFDPVTHDLLFERFLHTGKTSLPDIDIDVSSERRDEVLAWLEQRFPEGAEAMVANRVTYRLPLAIQDLGRALGIPGELRDRLSRALGRDYRSLRPHRAREAEKPFAEVLGDSPAKEALLGLLEKMEPKHFRHHSPHSGGVIASRAALSHYSPLTRSTGGIRLIQFDKDDAELLGLAKLDVLGLRMLSVFEHALEEIERTEGRHLDLADLPDEPAVWDAIGQGNTMGLFQLESPAQMRISVEVAARNLQDLAHQVALIRPGPIQSGTVHPFVRRKQGKEPITYPHPALEPILAKSYGVVLYQEDVLRIAVQFAGMDWLEADRFRKKVLSFEDLAEIEPDRRRFVEGAARHVGAPPEVAERIFDTLKSFQGFGFAESHAWAFGHHAYVSAWLRHHYPAAYFAGVLTAHPGMWSLESVRQELRNWQVGMQPLDVNRSGRVYRVERTEDGYALRPPLCAVKGVSEDCAREVMLTRLEGGPFRSLEDFYGRLKMKADELKPLVLAGAFDALHGRREALFMLKALLNSQPAGERPLFTALPQTPGLEPLGFRESFLWDHAHKGYSEREMHVMDLLRPGLKELGVTPLIQLRRTRGQVRTAGLVVSRQKPPTAKGVAFFVLEDGPSRVELVIHPELWAARAEVLRDARVLLVEGTLEPHGRLPALIAGRVTALEVPDVLTVRGYHY